MKVEAITDDSQLLFMDVTSEESVTAAVAVVLRKHKVYSHTISIRDDLLLMVMF